MKEQLSKSELKRRIINLAINEYVETAEHLRSVANIAKKYGLNKGTVSKYLKERGINVKPNRRTKLINDKIFDCIDTEEKAY